MMVSKLLRNADAAAIASSSSINRFKYTVLLCDTMKPRERAELFLGELGARPQLTTTPRAQLTETPRSDRCGQGGRGHERRRALQEPLAVHALCG